MDRSVPEGSQMSRRSGLFIAVFSAFAIAGCGAPPATKIQSADPTTAAMAVTASPASNFETVACPPEVDRAAVSEAACGYLTVPEDRQRPDGGTVRLFVVRQRPPGTLAPDPVLAIEDLGWTRYWSVQDQMPARVHREVISFDARGTGRSEPSLACPEIETAAPALYAAAPAGDAFPDSALEPVRQCHDRLVAEGTDLASYGVEAIAADAEDLRVALGIDRWNVRSKGPGSRIAWEMLRRYPASIRAAWFDSPEIPSVDFLSTGIIGMRASYSELAAACSADADCNAAYPDPMGLLTKTPEGDVLTEGTYDGKLIPLTHDPTARTLAVRYALAAATGVVLPALKAVANGEIDAPQDWYTEQPPFTMGYDMDQWDIAGSRRTSVFSHGALFSSLCHDQMPFVDTPALEALADGDDMYLQAYAKSPFPRICEIWDAGSAGPEVHTVVSSDIPSLLLVGQFDTIGVPSLVTAAARSLPASRVVEFKGYGHNVLALACAVEIRNAWLDDPAAAPDTSCADDLPPVPEP
jgi:pimeloyl-ACP methyl ester carboxylesterase